jgi:hypothetical protein
MRARVALIAAVIVALAGLAVSFVVVEDGWWAVSWLGYPIVGAAILWRIPGNRIGQLLLVIGIAWAGSSLCLALLTVQATAPAGVWIEMLGAILGTTAFLAMVLVAILFPAGLPTTKPAKALSGLIGVIWVLITATEFLDSAPKELTGLVSPLAVPALSPFTTWMLVDGFVIVPVLIVLALISLLTRWLRSTGIERLQYQWFCCALIVVVLVLVWFQLLPDLASGPIAILASLLVFNLIPLAIGFAVTRYRLYEIDRIVSRTVSYALVVVLLAGVFFAVVTAATAWLSADSDLAVAGSTLAVAALFNPLRRRVQSRVDRRFNRSRYDAERVMDGFAGSLRDRFDPDGLVNGWVDVVSRTMEPSTLGLWIRAKD